MAVSKLFLGMNARNYLFIRNHNSKRAKVIADNKVLTKKACFDKKVPTPEMLVHFKNLQSARDFNWTSLPRKFVLKPASGYGGDGILLVRKWDGAQGEISGGVVVDQKDLESHVFDILEGAFSLGNFPDTAFIEDLIIPHPIFKKMSWGGVPDVRVIVCNQVPVMAMLRLPTKNSSGKANLHLGALGVGIDLRTGITTLGIQGQELVSYVPDTKIKVRGIKIPDWNQVLEIAVNAQVASTLGYAGVDIVIDDTKGPLVLEVNARPGLSIQLANGASIRTRLERVAGIKINSTKAGIELAQSLFAEEKLSTVTTKSNVIGVIEKVTFIGVNGKKTVNAKIDSGAFRTALDESLVKELGFTKADKQIFISSGSGSSMRDAVHVTFRLRNKEIETVATYVDRSHLKYQAIIGRRDLEGFLIDPSIGPDETGDV